MVKRPIAIHVTFNNKCWLSLRLVRWHHRRIFVELFGSPSNSQQGKRPLPERVHSNQHRHPSSDRRGIQVKQPWPWSRSTTSTIELLHNYCTFQQERKRLKTYETSIQVWRHMTKLGWKEARLAPQNQNEQFWAVRQYVQLSCTKYEASRRKAGSYILAVKMWLWQLTKALLDTSQVALNTTLPDVLAQPWENKASIQGPP